MSLNHNMAGRTVCAVPAGIETKEADGVAEIKAALDGYARVTADGFRQITEKSEKTGNRVDEIGARLDTVEQKMSRRGGSFGGDAARTTWGERAVYGDEYKGWLAGGAKGTVRISVKAVLDSAGAVVGVDRDSAVSLLPKRRLTVRNLLSVGQTDAGSVEFVRQTGFTNTAAPVAEGALKPESSITFELANTKVVTIAHWLPLTRQALDDAAGLRSLVDGELRHGLAVEEELQLLLGSGAGQDLHGLVPQATAYQTTRTVAGDTRLDILHHAIAQAEEAELPASGIILNTRDWMDLAVIKDGEGRYIGPGPFMAGNPTIWGLPVVYTNSMPQGAFLVGAFSTAATIWDRMAPEVQFSDSDRDNFIRNLWTARCEERVAMAVKRSESLVTGTFPA